MDQESSKSKQTIITIVVIIIIGVITGAVLLTSRKTESQTTDTTAAAEMSSEAGQTAGSMMTPATTSGTYKDGTYTATGSYTSPGGDEGITISLTLKDGTVTATSAQSGANDHDAREFQADFIANYKKQVVGKKIDSISLSHISGSSLTSQGFNDALAQIKRQAQA